MRGHGVTRLYAAEAARRVPMLPRRQPSKRATANRYTGAVGAPRHPSPDRACRGEPDATPAPPDRAHGRARVARRLCAVRLRAATSRPRSRKAELDAAKTPEKHPEVDPKPRRTAKNAIASSQPIKK